MKHVLMSILLAVMLPSMAAAQDYKKASDIASWVTLGTAVALDAHATIGKCDGQDECYHAIVTTGLRVGITLGATALVKHFVQKDRPCAPACGIDSPDSSFFSGHTALAFSTVGGPRLAFSLPLAIGTGGLRVAAGKHYWEDVLVGAGVGLLTSRIR